MPIRELTPVLVVNICVFSPKYANLNVHQSLLGYLKNRSSIVQVEGMMEWAGMLSACYENLIAARQAHIAG